MAQRGPIFVARASYRQRRLRDGVRMMPVFGIVLWLIPLMSSGNGLTSRVGLFIFGVWLALIIVAGLIAGRMSRNTDESEGGAAADGGQN